MALKPKFSLGDRVVDVAVYGKYQNICYGLSGTVISIERHGIVVAYDDERYGQARTIGNDSYIPESVFNCPLYKALNEESND